jgi:hypothetical protein
MRTEQPFPFKSVPFSRLSRSSLVHNFGASVAFVTIMPFSLCMLLILNSKIPVHKPCLEDIVKLRFFEDLWRTKASNIYVEQPLALRMTGTLTMCSSSLRRSMDLSKPQEHGMNALEIS